ncbi:MAG: radical SAM protein [Bdellovibrionales bacterium]|jgi:wyosine [tRNA(Phe)-imidazoG37] synthetase (radical SAM superfamily)|nr:radical SAM protein [Bdellovibrionales bacterium]MBT3527435.1 radical SAM protein [Bdellovibrionales bacterium]MBT7669474.1 radical SAM protein [Bdellovibrionales bacterium]MBT7767807.1 radical SAM protein [Bdellovibrionales bacterium]
MNMQDSPSLLCTNEKRVYGPVNSWRLGQSLGIDPIFTKSTCSYNCIYCQLGSIQDITNNYKIYVPTDEIIKDLQEFLPLKQPLDIITYSGSGEPTLAANLGEVIREVRGVVPDIPQCILTNATMLHNSSVVEDLNQLDRVIVKLDAWDEEMFQRVNRPIAGVTLMDLVDGICHFRQQFKGTLEVQTMIFSTNIKQDLEAFAQLLIRISPDLVQLNTPKRPYPMSWHRENRGNHQGIFNYEVRQLKTITKEQATIITQHLKELTSLEIISIR